MDAIFQAYAADLEDTLHAIDLQRAGTDHQQQAAPLPPPTCSSYPPTTAAQPNDVRLANILSADPG